VTSFLKPGALALAVAGPALPGNEAQAAPLVFDCYSRSTSDLLMKSALDLSNQNLACVLNGTAQLSYQPVAPQPVVVQPVPAPARGTGESFLGSVIGGALGSVIGNALNGGSHTEHHVHHHNSPGNTGNQNQPSAKATPIIKLPGGFKPSVVNPILRKPPTLVQVPAKPAPQPGRVVGSGVVGGLKPGVFKPGIAGNFGGRLPL